VNIWNGDAYRWYLKEHSQALSHISKHDGSFDHNNPYSMEKFIEMIKGDNFDQTITRLFSSYKLGDLGKVYGYQWRNQNGVDQIADLVDSLQNRPFSRYHILDTWNKADFKDMALPPCHLLYQFIVRPVSPEERSELGRKFYPKPIDRIWTKEWMDVVNVPTLYLDLNMYQRSCDTFLGVPFNLASMSLLLAIFAKVAGMVPGVATWIGGDVHIYQDHIPVIKEQLKRKPKTLPILEITKKLRNLGDIEHLSIEDFDFSEYDPEPTLKAELFSGIKK